MTKEPVVKGLRDPDRLAQDGVTSEARIDQVVHPTIVAAVPVAGLAFDTRAGSSSSRATADQRTEQHDSGSLLDVLRHVSNSAGDPDSMIIRRSNPYAKMYMEPPQQSNRRAARNHPYAAGRQPTERQAARTGGAAAVGPGKPRWTPATDLLGNALWDGARPNQWYANVLAAMGPPGACAVQEVGCTGAATGIDHIEDFATVSASLPKYEICYRGHHFAAIYREDALDAFNGGNTVNVAVANVDTTNFQWACTHCNSSKSGAEGMYGEKPLWLQACPNPQPNPDGSPGCGYSLRGTPYN